MQGRRDRTDTRFWPVALWPLTALVWGLSEATLFFVVPDVLLTLAAVRLGAGRAVVLSLWALAGALMGGALMHRWGAASPEAATAMLDRIPAISRQMIAQVQGGMSGDPLAGMIRGSLTGIPYKIYATAAGTEGVPRADFLLASIPARLIRWTLLIAVTAGALALLRRWKAERRAVPVWAALWIAFYLFYFARTAG